MLLAPTLSINGSYGLATVEYNAVIVEGAGTEEVDGTYAQSGTYGGSPRYSYGGTTYVVIREQDRWQIFDEENDSLLYEHSGDQQSYPWLASPEGWSAVVGDAPAPTFAPATV